MEVVLDGGRLFITGVLNANRIELIPQSETLFTSGEGLSYEFIKNAGGAVTHVVEIHVSDNYPYQRQP